ncbi:MAG: hypothetical protein COC09_01305 [Gammaproteobacteria bacterium]|nr:MAG: hypothetical protein COC09_01305 [Gammaproteobacteria bacterium]
MTNINTITLPRTMVNALLHQAQLAGKESALGLISEKDKHIVAHYPIDQSANESVIKKTLATIKNNGEHVFAVYTSNKNSAHETVNKLLTQHNLLQLVISQDIKGVLQLTSGQQHSDTQEIQLLIS